jgi:Tfp pilus assembly protein PilV
MPSFRDRRRAQAGTTLVELLVSLFIAGLALAIIIGTISTGLLNATIAKRDTSAQAVSQYETERVGASTFSNTAANYSECFATENPDDPTMAARFGGGCPSSSFSLRADVSWQWLAGSTTVQVWTIAIAAMPSGSTFTSIQVYKVAHS